MTPQLDLVSYNPDSTLQILRCKYCAFTHYDIDAKTIYFAALIYSVMIYCKRFFTHIFEQ